VNSPFSIRGCRKIAGDYLTSKGHLREKRTGLEAALPGRIEPHHRLLIIELLAHVDYLDESIVRLSPFKNVSGR